MSAGDSGSKATMGAKPEAGFEAQPVPIFVPEW
jgi:hypothetical protein